MSSSKSKRGIFGRTEEQQHADRRVARQRKLDMLEAEAMGVSTLPPQGAIESARRFLFDEGEEEEATPTLTSANPHNHSTGESSFRGLVSSATAQTSSLKSRMVSSIRGSLFSVAHDDDDDDLAGKINLAPSSGSIFDQSMRLSNAHHAMDWDEYNTMVHKKSCLREMCSVVGDCCRGIGYTIAEFGIIIWEYISACVAFVCLNKRLCFLILGAIAGAAMFSFSIVAIVHRNSGGSSSSSTAIQDQVRYDDMRDTIASSYITNLETLDTPGTPQNRALRWLTDEDPGRISTTDEALLQRYALATLYFSTEGQWKYSDYWMSEKGICMWFGVSCKSHSVRGEKQDQYNANFDVLKLNLTDNNMRGFLPPELSALEKLQLLDLGKNLLSGSIPKSFESFGSLRDLYLEDNLLTGTLPSDLGMMTSMRDCFLGTNKFVGTIPSELSGMKELLALGLDENMLTGTIPDSLYTECTNLLLLYLDANDLTGSISPAIQNLAKMVDLRLRKNAFTGTIPPAIDKLTHVELLYLDDNKLQGTIPSTLNSMQRLEELQLYKNQLTGPLPRSFHKLAKLKILYVDNNKLDGTLPISYADLGDLKVLYVFNNAMFGSIPTEWGKLGSMVDLQLYSNNFAGPIPSVLANCYELQRFEAQDNALTGTIPSELGSLLNLEMLKLHRNKLSGIVPNELCTAKDQYQLDFVATDCSSRGGSVTCECCNACYP